MMLKPGNVILFSEAKRNGQNCLSLILPLRPAQRAHPPLALPLPASHAGGELDRRARAVAADNTKTQTFMPQLPAQLK